jgi:hypothetical protein
MELSDDAEGRVAIFAVDGASGMATEMPVGPRRPGRLVGTGARVAATLDSRYAPPALAAVLVILLVLGLILLRR